MRTLVLIFLAGFVTVSASAQERALLERMAGSYDIEGRMFVPGGDDPRTFAGSATWTLAHGGRYVHERFSLDAMGRTLEGEAFLGYSAQRGDFEFVQVDAFNPGMIALSGTWDEEDASITLETIAESGMPMMWKYRFNDDGSFIKEMYRRPGSDWKLMSDYTYRPREPGSSGD